MNLLCPNCQKMLTVPEEFAGQLMKCPLCAGTFTVPGLPGAAPPPPPSTPASDIYAMRPEPPPPAPPPMPDLPPPPSSVTTVPKPPAPVPSLSSLPTEGYQRTATLWLSPRILAWIAPVCLLLLFVLLFFNWVGLYPGGVPSVTQNAWQIAVGGISENGNLRHLAMEDDKTKPGWSVLTCFYLLLFFAALLVTVASVVVSQIPLKLPPNLEQLLPWRWGVVAAVNLIVFFFLGLQLLLGFSLDSQYSDWVDKHMKNDSKTPKSEPQLQKEASVRGKFMEDLHHTVWLKLVVVLHLLAIAAAALMFWISQRGTHRPMPKVELLW